jgi:purine-cytosine permease-like protein
VFFAVLAGFTFQRLHLSTFHAKPVSFALWTTALVLLISVVIQLLSINTIDMYSSGVTLQALGLPIRRWGAVILDTVVCAVVTGIILFHGNFYKDFSGFLLYIVVWLSAWFGILMTDYLLRGGTYDSLSLRSARGGLAGI